MDCLNVNVFSVALLSLVFDVLEVAGNCQPGSVTSIRYSDTIVNHTIVGPVLSNITAMNERECEMECHLALPPDMCYMFNYYPSSKVCELLYKGRAAEYKVEKKKGSTFKTRKCISNPCLPEYSCISLSDQTNISCVFIGKVIKASTVPVCVETKNDSYGTFFAPADGKIRTFKLVHISGTVRRVSSILQAGYWGTLTQTKEPGKIELLITDAGNSKVTPQEGFKLRNTGYNIPGQNNMSPELVFPEILPPLDVTSGKEFRIWFVQDFKDFNESNNGGKTCADVYVLYSS